MPRATTFPAPDSAQAAGWIYEARPERNLRLVFNAMNLPTDPVSESDYSFSGSVSSLVALIFLNGCSSGASQARSASALKDIPRARAVQAFAYDVGESRINQSYVLKMSTRAPTSAQRVKMAKAFISAYIHCQIAFAGSDIKRGMELLRGRIADVKSELETSVVIDAQLLESGAHVVGAALEPLSKSNPHSDIVLLLAAVFEALGGVSVVRLRHRLDRTIGSGAHIERVLQVDLMGKVPRPQPGGGRWSVPRSLLWSREDGDNVLREALGVLRTSILSVKKPSQHLSIDVVSWFVGEWRCRTASDLAPLIGTSEDRVVLPDADLPNPALGSSFVLEAEAGLEQALLDRNKGNELMSPSLKLKVFLPADASGYNAAPNIFIGLAAMQYLLTSKHKGRETVVDLLPTDLSSDTQAIFSLLDGAILIVEVNRTKHRRPQRIRTLRSLTTSILGTVLDKTQAIRGKGSREFQLFCCRRCCYGRASAVIA